MHLSEALCEHELDLEMADVLPNRDTLGLVPNITVAPTIVVVTQVPIAIQTLTKESSNLAAALAAIHV